MKKIIILLVSFSFLSPSLLTAQTAEEKRRVEEEKRDDLRPSEVQILKEEKVAPKPIAPIDLVYFAELIPRRVTYRYDACKALVLLMGAEDEYIDLDSQVAFLRKKNLLPKRFKTEFDPMKPLKKGLTAYMFCKALEIKGGLTLTFFGLSERYALKELAFEGVMASGNVNDIVSGEELVSILTQAANYMTENKKLKARR